LGGDSKGILAELFGGGGTETVAETSGAPGKDGAIPKFLTQTTKRTSPLNAVPLLAALGAKTTSTTEQQIPNPAHERAFKSTSIILGQSMANNGGIPNRALLAQAKKNFGSDFPTLISAANAFAVQTSETNRKEKFESGKLAIKEAIQAGWKIDAKATDDMFDYTYADTTAEVGAAAGAVTKLRRESPTGLKETFDQQTSFIQMQKAEQDRDLRLAQAEVDGLIVTGAGLRGEMTAQQIFTNLKDIAFSEGIAKLDSTAIGFATTLQLEQIAKGGQVNLFSDKWIGKGTPSSHRILDILDDFVIWEGRGFTKSGAIATSDAQIDREATKKKLEGAAKRLGALGVGTQVFEDGSLGVGIKEGSANTVALTRIRLIAQLQRAKEQERNITILNAYSWKPGEDVFEGFTTSPDTLFAQGPQPERVESARRAKARDRGEFARGAAEQSFQSITENIRAAAARDPLIQGAKGLKEDISGLLGGFFNPQEERR